MANGVIHTRAGVLNIAYVDNGDQEGWPVVLSHGFPYDVHAYDEVVPILVAHGARVVVPYLRGFGPARFISDSTPRVGQQAALGFDLVALMDDLGLETAVLGGYDWGGLASCVAAALWPNRVAGPVSLASYDVKDIKKGPEGQSPAMESVFWYQHLFQTERSRNCLIKNRRKLCHILWKQWSPNWKFSDDTFQKTADSYDKPDFVEVVLHAYRHAFGFADGIPEY